MKLTDREKKIILELGDDMYTPEFIEEWINRNDNVMINTPAALQAMAAKGYYHAVRLMAERIEL